MWIVAVALIWVVVCQSIPEGIFQKNLYFITFSRSKQCRQMENEARKAIPVLTRGYFLLVEQSLHHSLKSMPLPGSTVQMCSAEHRHSPFRGYLASVPLVHVLNHSQSMWFYMNSLSGHTGICLWENRRVSPVKILKLSRIWQIWISAKERFLGWGVEFSFLTSYGKICWGWERFRVKINENKVWSELIWGWN